MGTLRKASSATGARLLTIGLALVVDILIARSMPVERRGELSLVMLVASLGTQLCDFGLTAATTYMTAKQPQFIDRLIGGVSILASLELVALFLLSILAVRIWPSAKHYVPTAQIAFVLITFISTAIVQQAMNGMLIATSKVMQSNFVQVAQQTIVLFGIVGGWIVLPSTSVFFVMSVQLVSRLSMIALMWKMLEIKAWRAPDIGMVRASFSYGSKEYISNIIGFFSYRTDQIMISRFAGPVVLANYSIAASIAERIALFPNTAATFLMPDVARDGAGPGWKTTKKVILITTAIVCCCAAGVWLLGPKVINLLYSSRYSGVSAPLRILVLGIPILSVAKLLSSFLGGRGRPGSAIISAGSAACVSALVGYVLLKKLGVIGPAIGTIAGYLTAAVVIFSLTAKHNAECRGGRKGRAEVVGLSSEYIDSN